MELDHKEIAGLVLKELGTNIAGGLVGKNALDQAIETVGKRHDVAIAEATKQVEERIKGTYAEPLLAQIKALAEQNEKLDLAYQDLKKKSEAAPEVFSFDVKGIAEQASEAAYKNRGAALELTKDQHDALMARVKTLATTAAGSWGAVIQPQMLPGIQQPILKRLIVESLFASDPISGPTFRYVKENARTNAAAPVAEGAAKPEAALTMTTVDGKVEVIAHHIPLTKQLAADVPGSQSYIEAAMIDGVRRATETQLLTGDGVSPNLGGILLAGNFTAYNGPALGTADWTYAPTGVKTNMVDKIAHMIFSQFYLSDIMNPTGIVIHGPDILAILMAKKSDSDYIKALGGEVVNLGPDGILRLFTIPVATTNNATNFSGKALVGDFDKLNAQIFDRESISVTMGYINDDFTRNQFRLLVERRLGLAIRRPAAFIYG